MTNSEARAFDVLKKFAERIGLKVVYLDMPIYCGYAGFGWIFPGWYLGTQAEKLDHMTLPMLFDGHVMTCSSVHALAQTIFAFETLSWSRSQFGAMTIVKNPLYECKSLDEALVRIDLM